ncbi:hypothetical protein FD755_020122, partial [Muntiacus reevesi]
EVLSQDEDGKLEGVHAYLPPPTEQCVSGELAQPSEFSSNCREHASRKGSSSSLSRRAEEETQEEAPGAEPQFLFHGCKMP